MTTKPQQKKRKVPSDTHGGVRTGSTRVRVFKALSRLEGSEGLSHKEIVKTCGLLERSGHLGCLLIEEVNRGRIRKLIGYRGPNETETYVYVLSTLGRRDLDAGLIDGNCHGGNRIHVPWTTPRKKAESAK